VFDDIAFSDATICKFDLDTMVHDYWASARTNRGAIRNSVGTLKLDYRISFTGHPSETGQSLEMVVPLLKRTSRYEIQASSRRS